MKIDTLKNIIKEVVREVVREELKNLLTEIINPVKPVQEVTISKNNSPVYKSEPDDPILEMLNITKNSMNSQDYKNILTTGYKPEFSEVNLTSQNIDPSYTSQNIQSGIDITKLDFVKNAALIYNKSVEKDKVRLG